MYKATNASLSIVSNGYVTECKVMLCGIDKELGDGCNFSADRTEVTTLGKDAKPSDLAAYGVTPSFTATRATLPARMDDLRTREDTLVSLTYLAGCTDMFTGLAMPARRWSTLANRPQVGSSFGGTFRGSLNPITNMGHAVLNFHGVFGEDGPDANVVLGYLRTALGLPRRYMPLGGDTGPCAYGSCGVGFFFARDYVAEVLDLKIAGMAHLAVISQYNALVASGVSLLVGAGVTDALIPYDAKAGMAMECFLIDQGVGWKGEGENTDLETFDFSSISDLVGNLICVIDKTIAALAEASGRRLQVDLDRDSMVATADAAASAVANVNKMIAQQLATQEATVAAGGEISTDFLVEVAKTSTVALTQLAEQIEKVASGEITAADLAQAFSEEALAERVAAVTPPAAEAVENIKKAAAAEQEELSRPPGTPAPPTTPTTPTKPAKPATTAAPAEEEGGSSLGPAIGGAVGGLIVVIAIAYFIIQKKRVDPNSQGLVDAAGEGVVESVQSTARGSGFTFAFRS